MKRVLGNLVVACLATLFALLSCELGLRVYHGDVFTLERRLEATLNRTVTPRADYHSRLGWVPRPGRNDLRRIETVTSAGLRSNGSSARLGGRPILTVGDSFTFGDEVEDSATWPAQLERVLSQPVVNGGVFAYGIDQAVLRARILMEEHQPRWVVLGFIMDDVARSQFAYYWGWKPYFELQAGELVLRNVPVPTLPPPEPRLATLRALLARSSLAHALARRYADDWWYYGGILRAHADGVRVATQLIGALQGEVEGDGARFLAVALSTGGVIGSNDGAEAVLARLREQDVQVLNLIPEVESMVAAGDRGLFMAGGHYSARLNSWVAEQVSRYIAESDAAIRE